MFDCYNCEFAIICGHLNRFLQEKNDNVHKKMCCCLCYENVSQKLGRLQMSFVIIPYNLLDSLKKTCLILKVIL